MIYDFIHINCNEAIGLVSEGCYLTLIRSGRTFQLTNQKLTNQLTIRKKNPLTNYHCTVQ